MGLDDIISPNHPRKLVGELGVYKVKRNGIDYEATKLSADEELIFQHWWDTWTTRFSSDAGPYRLLTTRHFEQALTDCEIMKKRHFEGAKFAGGSPKEGEFGARAPLVEDLVGATDTEWGATTGGTGAWTAGQRNWISSVAQNAAAYPATAIKLRNTTAGEEWGWTFFGVESFAAQSVTKNILMEIGGAKLAAEPVEEKLRGTTEKVAVFDVSKFVPADKTFQVGVEVRTSAQDQLAPYPSVIWLTGSKAINTTHNRPT